MSQLLRAPPLASLISSIFFTRSLNSSYWHFSYECLSSCSVLVSRQFPSLGLLTYHTPPRQVVIVESAFIQRDKKVSAGVAVWKREFRVGHLLTRGFCSFSSVLILHLMPLLCRMRHWLELGSRGEIRTSEWSGAVTEADGILDVVRGVFDCFCDCHAGRGRGVGCEYGKWWY